MRRCFTALLLCLVALPACGGSASGTSNRPTSPSSASASSSTPNANAAAPTTLGPVTEEAEAGTTANGYRITVRRAQWGKHFRTWRVATPVGQQVPLGARAIAFVLHGVGGTGLTARGLGFEPFARTSGTVFVYPDAVDGSWNDARINVDARADRENVDDGGFLAALVVDTRTRFGIPTGIVGAAGFSNGGIMAAALACLDNTPFTALAVVAASGPPRSTGCATTRVPVVVVQGSADPVVPFNGGTVRPFNGRVRGEVIGHPEYMLDLVEQSSCRGLSTSTLAGVTPRTSREQGDDCLTAGLSPVGYVIEGGGHEWRRGPGFDTTRIVWDFFVERGAAPR